MCLVFFLMIKVWLEVWGRKLSEVQRPSQRLSPAGLAVVRAGLGPLAVAELASSLHGESLFAAFPIGRKSLQQAWPAELGSTPSTGHRQATEDASTQRLLSALPFMSNHLLIPVWLHGYLVCTLGPPDAVSSVPRKRWRHSLCLLQSRTVFPSKGSAAACACPVHCGATSVSQHGGTEPSLCPRWGTLLANSASPHCRLALCLEDLDLLP